jgi:hypothetical protein
MGSGEIFQDKLFAKMKKQLYNLVSYRIVKGFLKIRKVILSLFGKGFRELNICFPSSPLRLHFLC